MRRPPRSTPLYSSAASDVYKRQAERLVAGGYVKASYGRKKNLRAIWLCQEDGGNPVETHAQAGTRYSFIESLEHGRCWKLRRVDGWDRDGRPMNTRGVFLQVLKDCLVP